MQYNGNGVRKNTNDDFWDKVDIKGPEECWPWKEAVFTNGYGRFKRNYQSLRAHRVALEDSKGPPMHKSLLALHSCHNRLCCNPRHLRWGTHEENMEDRRARAIPAWNKSPAITAP
jgi:hypothetical protein